MKKTCNVIQKINKKIGKEHVMQSNAKRDNISYKL
jgi:hypothetical protein